jgi:hypothetical protein
MRLVANARRSWRWLSMQALTALAAAPLIWASIPADVQAFLPPEWRPWVLTAMAAAGIAGRLIDQGGKDA